MPFWTKGEKKCFLTKMQAACNTLLKLSGGNSEQILLGTKKILLLKLFNVKSDPAEHCDSICHTGKFQNAQLWIFGLTQSSWGGQNYVSEFFREETLQNGET